jgi:hypothetical protein
MPVTVTLHTVSERRPEHDQPIIFIDNDRFTKTYEFRYGVVEYIWDELGEDGKPNGVSIGYTADEPQPENTRLTLLCDGFDLEPDYLWAPADEMEDSLWPPAKKETA